MGCDGGTIPRRNELVKVKRKPETKDQASHLIFQWRYCNISQQVLQRPIVTCALGKLYNKSSILETIINKDLLPPQIKTLKDVVELKLTPNPDQTEGNPYICPVTGLEMSGKFKFVVLWSCGCVFADRVLREVKDKTCPTCQNRFLEEDVVVLNPGPEEEGAMVDRMKRRKKRRKLFLDRRKNWQQLSPH